MFVYLLIFFKIKNYFKDMQSEQTKKQFHLIHLNGHKKSHQSCLW